MYIYLSERYNGESELFIKKAFSLYCQEHKIEPIFPEILKTEKGKPFFSNVDLKFSISHSKEYIICAFSKQEIGIDIQVIKEGKFFSNICNKYFTQEEKNTIKSYEDFLDLWVKKEAYAKYLGTSLLQEIKRSPEKENVSIANIKINNRVKCAVITEEMEKICMRIVE